LVSYSVDEAVACTFMCSAAIGLLFEVLGDLQKTWFKNRPDSRGRHPDTGLWAITRHPNYFGEIMIWWGIFLTAAPCIDANLGQSLDGHVTILSPIFTMLILLFLSGMPTAEGQALGRYMKTPANAAVYREYRARTPPILPFVPACYRALPMPLKRVFCCEFPMYEFHDEGDDSDLKKAIVVGGGAAEPAKTPSD
jgi:steroid 5-alpha reductase family enzyme